MPGNMHETAVTPSALPTYAPISDAPLPDWVQNSRSWLGTQLEPVYATHKGGHDGLADIPYGAPTGYRFDNGNSQYVYLSADLGANGKPVVTNVQQRGGGFAAVLPFIEKAIEFVFPATIPFIEGANAAYALSQGSWQGALAAATNMGVQIPGIDASTLSTAKTALNVASAADALTHNNIGAFVNAAANATGDSTLKTIAQDINIAKAVTSGNPLSILNTALGSISKNTGTSTSDIVNAATQEDLDAEEARIDAEIKAKAAAANAAADAARAASVTGGDGNDTIVSGLDNIDGIATGTDTVLGGTGNLDTVTITGSNGNNLITDGNLFVNPNVGGGGTDLGTVNVTGSNTLDTSGLDTLTRGFGSATDTITGATTFAPTTVTGTRGDTITTPLDTVTVASCPIGQHRDPVTGACVDDVGALDTVTVASCPIGQHRDASGKCVPDELDTVTVASCPIGQHRDASGKCVPDELDVVTVASCPIGQHRDASGKCVPDEVVNDHTCAPGYHWDNLAGACVKDELDTVTVASCPIGQHRDASGKCVPDELDVVTVASCPIGQHRDPATGQCVPDEVVDTSCPIGQHRDPATGQCVPNTTATTTTTTTTPVLPVTPVAPVTPTPTGALPTYTDPTGIAGKIFTLGQLGGKDMPYNENLKQLTVPTMQHWADMADMAAPTVDVNKAMSALAQYAPDAEKDVIPSFYAHGGAVQHFEEGGKIDAAALSDAYARRDLMDAFKNLGNIGSGLEPLKSKVFQMGQMGTPGQQKQLQQMTVIPQLAALLQSRGMKLAEGGRADHEHPEYDGTPVFRTGGLEGLGGKYVEGKGDGTSDDITAMLANGEYVFSADVVSALGNGSNKAGAKELDHMVQAIRSRARSAPPDKLPPDAKAPLEYLKSSKGSKHG